ncbi:MAG: hypothetical protein ACYDCC_08665 [Actinomycetota bacterium]
MRKAMIMLIAIGGMIGVLAPAHADTTPPCAYLVSGGLNYTTHPVTIVPGGPAVPQTPPTVEALITTAAPTCPSVTYTMYVLDGTTHSIVVAQQSKQGTGDANVDGTGFISFSTLDLIPTPTTTGTPGSLTVCLYFTSTIGSTQLDRGPSNSTCDEITLDASGNWFFH